MNTNDIIKSLKDESIWRSNQPIPAPLMSAIESALDELDDIKETYANVIAERCASDEVHCACVPFLRMENDKLRDALRAIVTANATMQDMSQPLEDARRMLGDSK